MGIVMAARQPPSVVITEDGVEHRCSDDSVESVRWADLLQVNVLTTSAGPFLEDVFFELVGRNETGCLVPQCSAEFDQLFERFRQWPGFDSEQFARGMCCTDDARFVCWRRDEQLCSG
jgi:hypothetical protein